MVLRPSIAVAIVLSIAVTSCTGGTPESSDPTSGSSGPRSVELPQGSEPVTLDPAEVTTWITNPYWPMKPGTRWTFRETDGEGNAQDREGNIWYLGEDTAEFEGGKLTTKAGG